MVSYFGGKIDEKRKRKICKGCFVTARAAQNIMLESLKTEEPMVSVPLPILREATVVLDDSDEDEGAKTDSSEESELELEIEDGSNLEALVRETIDKLGIDHQVDASIRYVNDKMDALEPGTSEIDEAFDKIAKEIDAMRDTLYAPFRPEIKETDSITIVDNGDTFASTSGVQNRSVLRPLHTAVPTSFPAGDPSLPPLGQLTRKTLAPGDKVRPELIFIFADF